MITKKLYEIAAFASSKAPSILPASSHSWKWAVFFFVALLSYCVWWLDRGFEITDEAYYLLLAQKPEATTLFVSAQQWVMAPIWTLTGTQTSYRAAGFLILLLSGAFLARGGVRVWSGLNPDICISSENKTLVYICTISAALLYGSTINFSPCYNLIASAGAYVALGAVFHVAANRSNILSCISMFVLAGIAVSIQCLSKASAGICTYLLVLVVIASFSTSYRWAIYGLIVLTISFMAALSAIVLANTNIHSLQQSLSHGFEIFKVVQTETTLNRLIRYAIEYASHIFIMFLIFSPSIGLGILYCFKRNPLFLIAGFTILIITYLCGSYFFGVDNNSYDALVGKYESQIRGIMIVMLGVVAFSWASFAKKRQCIIFLMALFGLPYTVAIGTGNQLFTQVIVSAASWGTLLSLLYINAANGTDIQRRCVALLCAIFVTLISAQVISSGLRSPYNLNGSILTQSKQIEIGSIGKVKVDPGTYGFINALNRARDECDIAPGSPVLGLYNIPGVVLALQGAAPASPWINNAAQAETMMKYIEKDVWHTAVIALQMQKNQIPQLPEGLRSSFPEEYRLCGKAMYPYLSQSIEIWARR